ncbi:hypothetical protein AFM40_001799 [Escherichia coli]|nr:hypothetical protein [Escherichia coli]HEI3267956.1 hypothetical protein [Escherichia coli]
MNSIILEGFRQIAADEALCDNYTSDNILSALNKNGVTLITEMSGSVSSVCRTTQTINTVARTGLAFTTSSDVMLRCLLPDLSEAAVQFGFRLTLGEGEKYSSSPSHIGIGSASFTTPYPDEAASYYFEMFAAWNGSSTVSASLYCNRALVGSTTFGVSSSGTGAVSVRIGSGNNVFASGVSGIFMPGDMYCMTVPYGDNYDASPSLLGSIEVGYSPVTAFTGGSATNSLSKDVVAGLNETDEDSGYLLLDVAEDAAVVTFEDVDNTEGTLVAVQAAVTLRESASPNNLLAWSVGCGNGEGDVVSETEAESDTNSWTTVTQGFVLTPGDNTPFDAETLTFTANLYNKVKSEQETT